MYKIVVDSGCDLTEDMKNNNGIPITLAPLNLQLKDKHFIDDANLDIDAYLNEMDKCDTFAKTAAPSPELYLNHYKGEEEDVFAITLSSQLSGSYNSAETAKRMYLEEFGNKFIHVFDSLSASVAETLIALKINEFGKKGFSNVEIVQNVNKFISGMNTYFILEKFDNLVKNGRVNPYIAKIASVLSIKPICRASDDGKIEMVDKSRGYKKASAKLIDIMLNLKLDYENRILAITHVKCLERALEFKQNVTEKIKFKEVIITESSGLCSTYANRDGIIVAF